MTHKKTPPFGKKEGVNKAAGSGAEKKAVGLGYPRSEKEGHNAFS